MSKESAIFMRSEFVEQCQVVSWLKQQYPNVLFTASAGGARTSIGTAVKMKKMGYSKGCPDIMIFEKAICYEKYTIPNSSITDRRKVEYSGLFIELKREDGGFLSLEQRHWIDKLNERGYKAVVAKGFEEAKQVIQEYLEL